MLSLIGIDTKIVKILSFNFTMFGHFSALSGHMDEIGKKKVDIRHLHVMFSMYPHQNI